jgi:8-oxo-dGTP pyrophosphatase MutT (NUDIX family)
MTQPFEIINKDSIYAVKCKKSAIAVIIYTLDENQLLDQIGIVTEINPHFPDGTYSSIVMGGVETDDVSLLSRAKIETLEETGYDVKENERWDYMGEIYTSKILPEPVYCYSLDVTKLETGKARGDGSKAEKNIKFELVPINMIQDMKDTILQSCFFKLFSKLYNNELK